MNEAADVLTPDGAICVMICEEWVAEFGRCWRTPACTSAG
jgi:hypothetical protein